MQFLRDGKIPRRDLWSCSMVHVGKTGGPTSTKPVVPFCSLELVALVLHIEKVSSVVFNDSRVCHLKYIGHAAFARSMSCSLSLCVSFLLGMTTRGRLAMQASPVPAHPTMVTPATRVFEEWFLFLGAGNNDTLHHAL